MKAAAFDYVRPSTIAEVCHHLDDDAREAQIIAGGQSLVPMMAMRLARPGLLIDINDIPELQGIALDGAEVAIRACTRQAEAARSAIVRKHLPLLAKALPYVGHDQTRNRGTIGGSVAHADPSAEICLVAVTLDASLSLVSSSGERRVAVSDFLVAPMTTAIEPGECLTGLRFPATTDGHRTGVGFHEVSSRDSDFAIVAAAAQLRFDAGGECTDTAVAVANASPTPIRLSDVESALVGTRPTQDIVTELARSIDDVLDPDSDLHASARARRRIAQTLVARAVLDATAPIAEDHAP